MAALPRVAVSRLASGDGADDEEGFGPGGDRFWKRRIWGVVRQILFTGEKANEGPALFGAVVTHRPSKHRESGLKSIEHRPLRYLTC